MEINWQSVFYFSVSFAMIAFFIVCVWLIWLLFIVSKIIKNVAAVIHALNNISDDIRYIEKDIILRVLRFLSKIVSKKGGDNK